MTHRYAVPIPEFVESFAWIPAQSGVTKAAIFVHGFGGSPFGTWALFHEMVANDSWWDQVDTYFFNYDSVRNRIAASAHRLTGFVDSIFIGGSPGLVGGSQESVIREEGDDYEDLYLVGHSEGGLVIRNAVIEKATDVEQGRASSDHPLLTAHVRLFAPAIAGASLTGLLGSIQEFPGLRSLVAAFTGRSAAYKDMQETATAVIETRRETVAMAERHGFPGLSAHIVWAEADSVVTIKRYPIDSQRFEPDRTHRNICKPNAAYTSPMEVVRNGV